MFNGIFLTHSGESRLGSPRAKNKSRAAAPVSKRQTNQEAQPKSRRQAGQTQREAPAPLPPVIDSARQFQPSPEAPRELDSILSLYMREAGEVALLTPAEEIVLAAKIRNGDEAARDRMIRANLRFVIKIAREYEHLGMPLLDLINEGNIGLMKAVEKFDPAKGGKLTTYAALWIKQQIRRALASQGKTIRLPVHIADKIYHLCQAEIRLRGQLGREATDEELALDLKVKLAKISKLRRAAARPSSLDAPLGDENSSTVSEVVADENARSPFEQLRDQSETDLVAQLVSKLSEREARILRFRFGLDGGQERTLEDVGRKFNLTRERIRQLQNLALAKLRKMIEEPRHFPLAA